MNGRSKSATYPYGVRRNSKGKDLAPKALRKLGKKFLSECTAQELEKVSGIRS